MPPGPLQRVSLEAKRLEFISLQVFRIEYESRLQSERVRAIQLKVERIGRERRAAAVPGPRRLPVRMIQLRRDQSGIGRAVWPREQGQRKCSVHEIEVASDDNAVNASAFQYLAYKSTNDACLDAAPGLLSAFRAVAAALQVGNQHQQATVSDDGNTARAPDSLPGSAEGATSSSSTMSGLAHVSTDLKACC